jgi:glycosyltransferase involved in cell wall biosynthesis
LFHPDAYDFSPARLMGRQAASQGFLRALVAGRGAQPVTGFGPAGLGARFVELIGQIDPTAETAWIPSDLAGREPLDKVGVVHRADPVIAASARLRLRSGPDAYCLTGVTHTLSSSRSLEALAALLSAPLEAWDAVICTSTAARKVIDEVMAAETDYLRWKFGPETRISTPQFPVIPLGVHTQEFDFTAADRKTARERFRFEDDEVVALYAGRLSYHSKSHPLPMLKAAQAAVERTGRKLVLACYGQAPSEAIGGAFADAAARFAPSVRTVFLNGAEIPSRDAWASADLFVSFADSLQETFGLTPVEAMAAGLPCLVSDWNGYRDTVRDGVDGFLIPTFMPVPGAGEVLARAHEAGTFDFDINTWQVTATVGVDVAAAIERLVALVTNAELRRTMAESGKARARETFDWRTVLVQYQTLWTELNARRLSVREEGGDRCAHLAAAPLFGTAFPDPYAVFRDYPTHRIGSATKAVRRAGVAEHEVRALLQGSIFRFTSVGDETALLIWEALATQATIEWLSYRTSTSVATAVRAVALLAKMDVVVLSFD